MTLLYAHSNSEFRRCTGIYESEFNPFVEIMEDEVLRTGPLGRYSVFEEYAIYVKWPVRKLEYSFILLNIGTYMLHSKKILDLGCGVAPLPNYYSRKQAEVIAVDIDQNIVELLGKFGNQLYDSNVHYRTMDITKRFDYPDETFDIITCVSVLEHLNHGQDIFCLREMLRVLKPHGKIVMTIDFVARTRWTELVRIAKKIIRFAYPLRLYEGRELLELKEEYRRAIGGVRLSNQAYTPLTLEKVFGSFLRQYGDKDARYLSNVPSSRQIRRFWQQHYFPGCLYDYNQGRNYVSLGIVLSKDPILRRESWLLE